ncbi:septal ring lytic transglycosylase RlpA family protein [Neisseria sp. N95_16]|uniref:Endolytic peptidoglycan transglycosylase RlpA n=1 Tax=Neisseria brasiliensis TaxID=2666100 RepID=A0A5Q3RYZ9_9NEIS|nr:septal ring lytic transglycosylase RlpA family protein [Neisseria brasiliensis]PJO09097.1 septal ring lytic transglycosylase RlpA family protein [Neisseria sp. N95_16]PJO78019.1 septal ring lytic transglycosylase RlpA family protein [Neisseria sp. N177_16]QGL24975.1 septal ring lytic transglycosylase RlpA family protein [Neisseria brasiliensis]
MDFVLTFSHHTLFATLTAVAIGVFSIGNASAQTAKGALLAKQANEIIVTQQDTIVRAEKLHPSANRSYKVAGKRYQPMTKVSSFSQSGNASWYGGKFHGRKTASGERYNMHAMTAAHRTLPIPSYAKVTNTRNGKSVIVRVNDRGPFHGNRVMDLSKAAAQKLGFINQGTAHVKIEQIVPGVKTQQAAAPKAVTPKNTAPAAIAALSPVQEIYVDLKAFGTERDAQAYINRTTEQLASSLTSPKMAVEKRSHEYVVRMGPFTAQERADEAETRVRSLAYSSVDSAI